MKIATIRGLAALLLGIVLIGSLQTASAQIELGGRLGYDVEVEELHIGAEARFSVESIDLPIVFKPSFDYFFIDNGSLFSIDANAVYEFGVDNQAFTPYAGAGLSIGRISFDVDLGPFGDDNVSDTEVGLNLLAGAVFGSSSIRPFAEARVGIGGFDFVTVTGGLLFRLGS